MPIIQHNPENVYPPYRCYSHALEIRGDARLLIISGLNGYLADGKTMPDSFEEQGELVWQHLGTILRAADMSYSDLVSVRVYLASPQDREANTRLGKIPRRPSALAHRGLMPAARSQVEVGDRSDGSEVSYHCATNSLNGRSSRIPSAVWLDRG